MKLPYIKDEFGDPVLDKAAFKTLADKVVDTSDKLFSTEEGQAKLEKSLASLAGVAELQQIEADFEVLNVYRHSIPLDICEMRPLPLGELPLFRSKYINPVGITIGGLAGVGATEYYATRQFGQRVFPFTFKTNEVMVPNLNNIYDMQRLMERRDGLKRIDEYVEIGVNNSVINTVFSNPSTPPGANIANYDPAQSIINYAANGGSFAGKTVYILDPGVRSTALPTVNFYDLSSTENGLTKKVVQTINTHSMQIERAFPKMYIPQGATSGHAPVWEALQNLATPVALVTGQGNQSPEKAVPSEMWSEFQKDDFRGAVRINWFGLVVDVVKQNWMPEGYLVLFSNQPSAILWDRLELTSGQPQDGTLETPENGYYSRFSRSKNIATCRPDWALRNFLVIKVNA